MAEPMTPQRFEVRGRGASDELIERMRQSVRDTAEHEHPVEGRGPDLFCLNQVAFRGEYTAAVLERLRQAEADLARARQRIDALTTDEAIDVAAVALAKRDGLNSFGVLFPSAAAEYRAQARAALEAVRALTGDGGDTP